MEYNYDELVKQCRIIVERENIIDEQAFYIKQLEMMLKDAYELLTEREESILWCVKDTVEDMMLQLLIFRDKLEKFE